MGGESGGDKPRSESVNVSAEGTVSPQRERNVTYMQTMWLSDSIRWAAPGSAGFLVLSSVPTSPG